MPARNPRLSLSAPAILVLFALAFRPAIAAEDLTEKLEMRPGLKITFPVTNGIDTHWKPLGNYNFQATIEKCGADGFSFAWSMGDPRRAEGSRAVEGEDMQRSLRVSLFYPRQESATMVGYTNIVRVSDALYQALKTDDPVPFFVDGPEIPAGHKDNPDVLPTRIHRVGEETVNIYVNDELVPVRAIKAQTNNGWTYWILDNPRWPLMVQGEHPFSWKEPRLTNVEVAGAGAPAGAPPAQSEAGRLIGQLEDKGVATTRLILFDFNSDKLKDQSKSILKELGRYLGEHPGIRLKVEGHTDSIGGSAYNLSLSRRRASSVKNYLVRECGIAAARLSPAGFGFTRPVASNKTAGGRAQNRRVVFRKF